MRTPRIDEPDVSPELAALPAGGAVPGNDADLARVGDAAETLSSPAPRYAAGSPTSFPDLPDLSEFTRKPRWTMPVFDWAGKRIEWVTVGLALAVSLLLAPYVIGFSHHREYGRIIPNLPFYRPLESTELHLYDAHFTARDRVVPRSLDKIAIVGIDDNSISTIGEMPMTRDWHAKLIRRLKKAGARVIALDLNLHSYQLPKKDPITGDLLKDASGNVLISPYDKALIAAVKDTKTVAIPSGFRPASHANQSQTSTSGNFTSAPIDELDANVPDIGLNFQPEDSDGAARNYTIHAVVSGAKVGSFSSLVAAMYQHLLDGNENKMYNQYLDRGVWPDLNGVEHLVPTVHSKVQDDDIWTTPIDFYGPPGTFPTYSFSDLVLMQPAPSGKGTQSHELQQPNYLLSDKELESRFKDRIVYVGATSEQLKDFFPLPPFKPRPGEAYANQIPGVEVHATVTAMLLDGAYIYSTSIATNVIILFALTLIGSLWTVMLRGPVSKGAKAAQTRWRKWNMPGNVHSLTWLFLYACVAVLPIIVYWQVTQLLFNHRNLWVVFTYPALSNGLSSGMALLLLFGVESQERRKAVKAFSRHVSPDVLDEILSHPEEDHVRARRVHATLLFTDLEGFTTYSENHEPEEVVAALNDYISRMEPIVLAYGGSIDKFIGDAIMAWFGAIVPRYDHAAQGLLCAIAMQEECARFRAETGIEFYMRIGVHTGDVIIGYTGSETRADFTAIGDTVNLASRLEGKNKEFGSWIMCSAATYEAAPHIVSVESASAQIKGKSQAVEVYMVRGVVGDPVADNRWGRQLTEAEKQKQLMEAHLRRIAEAEAALSEAKELPVPLRALPQGAVALMSGVGGADGASGLDNGDAKAATPDEPAAAVSP